MSCSECASGGSEQAVSRHSHTLSEHLAEMESSRPSSGDHTVAVKAAIGPNHEDSRVCVGGPTVHVPYFFPPSLISRVSSSSCYNKGCVCYWSLLDWLGMGMSSFNASALPIWKFVF